VSWDAERTDEFDSWWQTLTDPEQRKVVASVEALQELGPSAGRPLVDSVEGSRHSNMKELRVTQTMRIFFAFDPKRVAILLIGGDKAGKTKRFYKRMIPIADSIYQQHLQTMDYKDEGSHGKAKAVRRAKRRGS
jgi:hypothetical protein